MMQQQHTTFSPRSGRRRSTTTHNGGRGSGSGSGSRGGGGRGGYRRRSQISQWVAGGENRPASGAPAPLSPPLFSRRDVQGVKGEGTSLLAFQLDSAIVNKKTKEGDQK